MLEPWAEISERLRRIHQNFCSTESREVRIAAISLSGCAPEFTVVILSSTYKKIFCPVSWKENNEARRVKTFRISHLTF